MILGAQAPTHSGILGTGTAFGAQKQFLGNVEEAISSPVDLPPLISHYHDVLQYAGSEVNFAYMASIDKILHAGRVPGYYNLIIIATEAQTLGLNSGLNMAIAPLDARNDTGERGLVEPTALAWQIHHTSTAAASLPAVITTTSASGNDHEDEKQPWLWAALSSHYWHFGFLTSHSRAATSSKLPTTRMTTHKFSASQPAVLERRLRSHKTMEPMIPGGEAAALQAIQGSEVTF